MNSPRDTWKPTARFDTLKLRAGVLAAIRRFFAEREVMEVETPALSSATVTDLHLHSFSVTADDGSRRYLQTSPEYAMKRLLAAGSGPVFQMTRAFRGAEAGRRHNPEFTILEWYRPGWDHHRLMDEIDDLLGTVLGVPQGDRITYAEAFATHSGLDPFTSPTERLRLRVGELGVRDVESLDRDDVLNLLLSHVIEPRLGRERPTFLHDFPESQAALARVRPGAPPLAERFEVFIEGLELANGYHELTDPGEQRRRFERDAAERRHRGLPEVAPDERLLAALEAGLPDCAGVALGIDRLVMIKAGVEDISQVIAFPIDRA